MEIKKTWRPETIRKHDRMIMTDIFYNTKSPSEQQTINNWRPHFQVCSIAKMANYAGDRLQKLFI
jgi:hypothetical protein